MPEKAEAQAAAARLRAQFEAAGAMPVEADILLPADTLLDLYGEDIRARAYVTSDPLRGEQMLRPDFTVPVVQMHLQRGETPARYTYAGEVFRRQEHDTGRASEYLQVGYEVFDAARSATAEAEVFALIAEAASSVPLRAATGDIGILTAAVGGLGISDRRRAALMRHIWRPRRFRALLDRFSGRLPVPPARTALLAKDDPLAAGAPEIGLRSRAEIAGRVAALRADAEEPPIPGGLVDLIDALLAVRERAPFALEHLRDIAVDLPSIGAAVEGLSERLEALAGRGVDVEALDFEASYGRTMMEYYDGFVFGLYAEGRTDLPPVATGGRYDALTRAMGGAAHAVGGVIRPGLLAELEGAA